MTGLISSYCSIIKLSMKLFPITFSRTKWTSSSARTAYIDYFTTSKNHDFIRSSSVVPDRGSGLFFTNAGMNQFKPIFMNTIDHASPLSKLKRVTNSQKCVRTGGKHNDLEQVGLDHTHHTFFEMLGNWSFGDYFRGEAISMAWEVLTRVYSFPPERLYVTYFAGDESLGLKPDFETRDLWLQTGVLRDRIVSGSTSDNFWDMGETGPCGPCTEIHYDLGNIAHGSNSSHLVNSKVSSQVFELWNIVFMQFNRLGPSELEPLSSSHVDTGMGLERLIAILQNKTSNYDTDLFLPIIKTLHKEVGGTGYTGSLTLPFDISYRVVVDHIRMICVSIADNVHPASRGMDGLCAKLRSVIQRAFHHLRNLDAPPFTLSKLVPSVVESLGTTYPELQQHYDKILDVLHAEEELYMDQLSQAFRVVSHHLVLDHEKTTHNLTERIFELRRKPDMEYLTPEILTEVSSDLGLPKLDFKSLDFQTVEPQAEIPQGLSAKFISNLMKLGLPPTDDSFKYRKTTSNLSSIKNGCPSLTSEVLAIFTEETPLESAACGSSCCILTDKTNFYYEAGGQAADTGSIVSEKNGCKVRVLAVQSHAGYVLHRCEVLNGEIRVGSEVQMHVDQTRRSALACNHSCAHLLNFTLKRLFEDGGQAGSTVQPDQFTFSYSCKSRWTNDDLTRISAHVNTLIASESPLSTIELPFSQAAQIQGLITLPGCSYPNQVRVVTADQPSAIMDEKSTNLPTELCCGTHVSNSADIQSFVITGASGLLQNIKKVTAVTGPPAVQAHNDALKLSKSIQQLISDVNGKRQQDSWNFRLSEIYKAIGERGEYLPKVEREEILDVLEKSRIAKDIKSLDNQLKADQIKGALVDQLNSAPSRSEPLYITLSYEQSKQIIKVLSSLPLDDHRLVLSNQGMDDDWQTVAVNFPANDKLTEGLLEHISLVSGSKFRLLESKSTKLIYTAKISSDIDLAAVIQDFRNNSESFSTS